MLEKVSATFAVANDDSFLYISAVSTDRDVLMHHPFDSFAPVIEMLQLAAKDPKVVLPAPRRPINAIRPPYRCPGVSALAT